MDRRLSPPRFRRILAISPSDLFAHELGMWAHTAGTRVSAVCVWRGEVGTRVEV